MTVAVGLMDRRIVFYRPEDGGADGFARTVYVRDGEWWGRIDDTADVEQVPLSPQAHVEGRISGVATVADYASVPRGGLARVAGSDTLYHVRGIVAKRAVRAQFVTLEAIEPTAYGEYDIYDALDVLDGLHLVTPGEHGPPPETGRAFDDSYSSAFG